ncbi:MAG: amidase [Blastocatellia bacterium]|nr:amidase [Blastocatellia bacterium]
MTEKSKSKIKRSGLNRRKFLQAGIVTSAVAAVTRTSLARVSEPAPAKPISAQPFEFDEATIDELQQAMKSGKHTSHEITAAYLSRVQAIDKNGPAINSIIELNPEALDIADRLDKERRSGKVRGPLHGIPIVIKDNIDTADRMQTTAGSLALVGSKVKQDAFIVQRLRDSGAIILGKTNLSEWANFRSTHSTSGWSGRGHQTCNPYVLDRNPCGSSSGTGAGISANLATIGIGTETDGSIVCPSSANGIVGIKPTLGMISRAGIIPIAHSQDTAGPMARTVRDAAILLGVLVGADPRDKITAESHGRIQNDYTKFLDQDGLRGARIGIPRKFYGFNDRVDKLMSEAIDVMKKSGAEIIDPAEMPTAGKFDDSEFEVLLFEFKADLNAYLTRLGPGAPVSSLKDIIEFNETNRDREMTFFGQEIMTKAEAKGPLTDKAYLTALAQNHKMSREGGIDEVMIRLKLDALVAPTGGPAWTTDLINGDHSTGGSSTPAAVAGYPNINVPGGYVYGLPVGISFFGRAFSEPKLIRLAYAFEQATKHRKAPGFFRTSELS